MQVTAHCFIFPISILLYVIFLKNLTIFENSDSVELNPISHY